MQMLTQVCEVSAGMVHSGQELRRCIDGRGRGLQVKRMVAICPAFGWKVLSPGLSQLENVEATVRSTWPIFKTHC